MPLIRVTLTDKQFSHIDKLATVANVEHGEIIRTLVDLDLQGSTQCPAKVIDLVGQLYSLVVGKPDAQFNSVAEAVPVLAEKPKNRKGTITTPEQDAAILDMREQGHTWREIEEYFELAHGTVFRAAARARKRR